MMNFGKNLLPLTVFATIATSTPAIADTVKRNELACISEDLLDEATRYLLRKDKAGLTDLIMGGNCVLLKVGEQVSVISKGFIVATIRYKGVKLFTASETVR